MSSSSQTGGEYDQSRLTRRDPKYLWVGKHLRDWAIDETMKTSLQSLTKDTQYFQLDPYKYLLCTLRSKEFMRIQPTIRAMKDIPMEPDVVEDLETVTLVRIGDTAGIVMKHLFRLVGLGRLKYSLDVLSSLKV